MPYFALLDDAVSGISKYYQNHKQSRFLSAQNLDTLDTLLHEGWQQGWSAVLCTDYEFGLPLLNLPDPQRGCLALHWFESCETVDTEVWLTEHASGQASGISTPANQTGHADYLHAIQRIHEAIRRGDTYQINYTTRLHFDTYGHPIDLYRRLRQPVPYAALSCLPDADDVTQWTLCFSPELFLKIGSDGLIRTEPMKGTAPVLNDGQDEQRAAALKNDPKNRAENIMIVDLLRNDLGKIAQTGQVRVPEPFKVSRFGSVWQMTTEIQAKAQPYVSTADIFRAAFPCGSITGAPKRMSMHIIQELETAPRGLYTGSIGFLQPCKGGLGFEGVLNVVIRTLVLRQKPSEPLYRAEYGVGSGIVIDSAPQAEWEECGWKARFVSHLRPEFGIFETLKVEHNQCLLLKRHLDRLKQAAFALNLLLPPDAETQILAYIAAMPSESCRLKIAVHPDSDGLTLTHAPLRPLTGEQQVLLADTVLPRCDYLRRFKTTRRATFDQAWQNAEQQQAFDSLLFNTDGVLLEGGRSNVFVKINGQWHTPSLDLDILNGVMRQEILHRPHLYLHTDHVRESRITRDLLQQAEQLVLSNALRGCLPVTLRHG